MWCNITLHNIIWYYMIRGKNKIGSEEKRKWKEIINEEMKTRRKEKKWWEDKKGKEGKRKRRKDMRRVETWLIEKK